MRIDELNTKIIEWACRREIDRKGTIQGQTIKTIEEIGELVKSICKNDTDPTKDSIGDAYATLAIGRTLNNIRVCTNYTLNGGRCRPKRSMLERITNEMFKLSICNEPYDYFNVAKLAKLLEPITIEYKTSLSEYVQLVYDEINSRKEKMIGGVSAKEVDLK